MAYDTLYATLANLRERKKIPASDTSNDARFTNQLTSAKAWLEELTRRNFNQGSAGEQRVYTAFSKDRVFLDDCVTITAVETDDDVDGTYETAWATTDYESIREEVPLGVTGPIVELRRTPYGTKSFPSRHRRLVRVTGTFGWPAVPRNVIEAHLRLAERLEALPGAALGIENGTRVVSSIATDDVMVLLSPLSRTESSALVRD